jgi:hypothetical protein
VRVAWPAPFASLQTGYSAVAHTVALALATPGQLALASHFPAQSSVKWRQQSNRVSAGQSSLEFRRASAATLLAFVALAANASNAQAQAGRFVLSGRVTERGQDRPIAQATVTLDDELRAITNANGEFQLNGVQAGRHALVVEALGYRTLRTTMLTEGNGSVQIQMDPAALPLPAVTSDSALVTLQGSVKDKATGAIAPYLTIRLDNGDQGSTNAGGSFRFRRIPAGQHRIRIEGFGWEPAEFKIELAKDTTIELTLERDRLADRIIENQVKKLTDRLREAGLNRRLLERNEFLAARAATPVDIIQARGGVNIVNCPRIRVRACLGALPPAVYIDEMRIPCGLDVLASYPTTSIQRIEVIERGSIIRVYTIWFMERMNAGRVILHPVDPLWDAPKNDC